MQTIREQAEEIVARQVEALARDLAVSSSLHGWSPRRITTVEAVDDVVARLEAQEASAATFRKTPRGRFLTCVDELEALGYATEAYKLHSLYSMSISTLNGPEPDQRAVGEAVLVLNGIGTSTAREGIDALAELLTLTKVAA